MRTVLLLLLAVTFAGCSDGGGPGKYVMTTGDLGAGFFYVPIDDENQGFFFDLFNMTTNPGFGDERIVEEDGGFNVTSLYVAIMGYNGSTEGAVFSAAVAFRSGADLDAWLAEEFDGCEEGDEFAAFRHGSVLSIHDGEDVDAPAEVIRAGIDRFQARTGGTPVCTPMA